MAETKDPEETTLPVKRKPEPTSEDQADFPNKSQKLQLSGNNSQPRTQESEKRAELEDNADPQVEDEEEEEDSEESIGKSEVDRKGKGIMRTDKGKGILIEDEEEDEEEEEDGLDSSDDDSSSSDGGSEFEDGENDLSDDPLAEVDLDNILPSRTRRRQVQPGVYIRSDNNNNNQDDDSDDSDD